MSSFDSSDNVGYEIAYIGFMKQMNAFKELFLHFEFAVDITEDERYNLVLAAAFEYLHDDVSGFLQRKREKIESHPLLNHLAKELEIYPIESLEKKASPFLASKTILSADQNPPFRSVCRESSSPQPDPESTLKLPEDCPSPTSDWRF